MAQGYVSIARWRLALLAALMVLCSVAGAALILRFELVPPIVLLACLLVAAICWQPRFGVYLIFGLVLLFEAGGPDDLMLPGRYLNFGLQSSFGISGFIVSPLELLMFITCAAWLTQGIASHRLIFRGGTLLWPMLLFFLAVVAGLARGAFAGGDLSVAFWEARALLYLLITYIVTANTISERRHLVALTTITVFAGGAFAIEGAYRQIVLANTALKSVPEEFLFLHDTVIFLGTTFLLVIALWVYGSPLWLRLTGLLVAPISLFTLFGTQRRAGSIALIVAFMVIAIVLLMTRRKVFFLFILPIIGGFLLYLPLFWNNTGVAGQPARAIRSLSEPDQRDASSNDYRLLEKINVSATIRSEPIFGVGFGREFYFVVALPSLSWWEFWRYEPHHNILWVWLKTGAPGFAIFWLLVGCALARATRLARRAHHREIRVFSLLALAGIVQTLVFCYVDLGLVDGRITVFLGTIMGGIGALDQLDA
jgi:O-antigen ligase